MSNRFRAAADLSYHAGQLNRHAVMLEAYLTHGIQTADTLIMLASDLERCTQAFLDYRNASLKKETTHDEHPTPAE